ncbi:MAG: hypothetical protein ABEJ08_06060 [Halobacteriaceae archaeon]
MTEDGPDTAAGDSDDRVVPDGDGPEHLDDVPDGAGCAEIWEVLGGDADGDADRAASEEADDG